jgi:hypothetical protein
LNTGIYWIGADNIGIVTGGTKVIDINSSQNVGIGAASFGKKFEVTSAGDQSCFFNTGAGSERLCLDITSAGTKLRNYNTSGTGLSYLFEGFTGTEYARLNSTGLGIGISPSYKLDVLGQAHVKKDATGGAGSLVIEPATSTLPATFLFNNGGSGVGNIGIEGSAGGTILPSSSAYAMVMMTTSTREINFGTNNVLAYAIDTSGILTNKISGNESTGAGTALLGTNSPAVTNSAPYKWLKVKTSDGSTGYIPIWK